MQKCITYDCTKKIVFVDILHHKTLYINIIVIVIIIIIIMAGMAVV